MRIFSSFLLFLAFSWHCYAANSADSLIKAYHSLEGNGKPDSARVVKMRKITDLLKYKAADTAYNFSSKGINYSQMAGVPTQEGFFLKIIGDIKWHIGDLDSSLFYYQKALNLYDDIGSKTDMAYMLCDIGYIHMEKNQYKEALEKYYEAHEHALAIERKDLEVMSNSYIAQIHFLLEEYDKALETYRQSLNHYRETGNQRNVSIVLTNMGNIFLEKKDYEKALQAYEESLEIKKSMNDPKGRANLLTNIGAIYMRQDDPDEALDYFLKASKIYELIEDNRSLIHTYTNIGNALLENNRFDEALDMYEKSRQLAKQQKDLPALKKIHQNLSDFYFQTGRYKDAYHHHVRHTELEDTLRKIEKQEQINKLVAKYETKQKELKINNLEKEQALQKAKIKRENTQKMALAAGLGLTLVLIFFILRSYRQKKRINEELKEKNREVIQQKTEVEHQKAVVEEKNREITDSINYAKRLQSAILPPDRIIKDWLPDSFIFYQPKEIVAGDFYFMERLEDRIIFAAADCTGHGVPGAMVSVVCHNALSRAVNEFHLKEPAAILDKVRDLVEATFEKSEEEVKDGMDIALCSLNFKTNELEYAGANNPLWIFRKGKRNLQQIPNDFTNPDKRKDFGDREAFIEIKPDKQPIGKHHVSAPFTNHRVQLRKEDTLYLFSDGYPDQFGGEKGKKLKYKNFRKLLHSMQGKPMLAQKEALRKYFEEWKGSLEQIDDVCIIGYKAS